MNERRRLMKAAIWPLAAVVALAVPGGWARSASPVDLPPSNEPRVEVAKCLSAPGLLASEGNGKPFLRVLKGEKLFSRDLLVALPGFKVDVEPAPNTVTLTLWGNLPGLSASPVLESSVILHDTRAYDLDFTFLGGRIVLTNTRKKGAARIWLRAREGIQVVLPAPGDSVAVELYGRWPAGVPFSPKKTSGEPVILWEVHCLKGNLEIKAARTEWYMSAPPGAAYFHGDSESGPAGSGPERRKEPPAWANPKAEQPALAKKIQNVVEVYAGRLRTGGPEQVARDALAFAEKEKDAERARVIRTLVVHAMGAVGNVERVVEILGSSKYPEARQAAVVGLRHWIGSRPGRDERLYETLQEPLGYTRTEADTVLQLLHSPFDPLQPETYETLIAYLNHRRQAVRELAHWHLVRLAPIGRNIPYDAAAPAGERAKAVTLWKAKVPAGELPKDPDETKNKE